MADDLWTINHFFVSLCPKEKANDEAAVPETGDAGNAAETPEAGSSTEVPAEVTFLQANWNLTVMTMVRTIVSLLVMMQMPRFLLTHS